MTEKRRHINQLPAIFQTATLKKFFAATVDEVFQPGSSEQISGYIGQKPSYWRPETEFYVPEPTEVRQNYQLETSMISLDANGAITRILPYDDMLAYIRSRGGLTDDPNRLFKNRYYSWAPPVDLDKLNSYGQYYWFGDDPSLIPTVQIDAPVLQQIANGSTSAFMMPAVMPGCTADMEEPAIFINGERIVDFTIINAPEGDYIDIGRAPLANSAVVTLRYGDLKKVIEGREDFILFGWSLETRVTKLTTSMRLFLNDAESLYTGWDVRENDLFPLPFEDNWFDDEPFDWPYFDLNVRELAWDEPSDPRTFYVDGVGTSIVLSPDTTSALSVSANYVTIDRRSRDGNPWSRNNHWVHHDAFSWAGKTFPSRKARRPILEFLPNIELYDYGQNRLLDVDCTLTFKPLKATYELSQDNFDLSLVGASNFNLDGFSVSDFGDVSFVPVEISAMIGAQEGMILVDGGHVLRAGERILIKQENPTEPSYNNRIYRVMASWESDEHPALLLNIEEEINAGDIVRLKHRGPVLFETDAFDTDVFSHSEDQIEYVFDGNVWKKAQTRITQEQFPLFRLYDMDNVALDDAGVYPSSSFQGSRIFGYLKGTGASDSVLNYPLTRDTYGAIIFENDQVTRRYTYESGEINGYYQYRIVGDAYVPDEYSNAWHLAENYSQQNETNGVYELPTNLRANPDNEQVTTISRNEWFEHFNAIISSQGGFEGYAFSRNNWRDTRKVLNTGTKILQHRAPLLRAMLMMSDEDFDFLASSRYVEREYTRWRNRFIQKITEFRNNGVMLDTDTPPQWVEAIFKDLKLNKTSSFPFALSTVAGGQYFIPPTPAALGILPCYKPEIFVDNTYDEPVTLIRGHDGSLIPSFDAFRDPIILEMETRIYNAIDARFREDGDFGFDIYDIVGGKFRQSGYTHDEYVHIRRTSFLHWSQDNRVNYRENNGFIEADPFTWNYSQTVDKDGAKVPGHWRGIYRFYFDTDRPHEAPWEMLGFRSKPDWWDSEYGPAPYTRGNLYMWEHIRDGFIAQGPRTGVDTRFTRPDLLDVLPIDDYGNLLNPIEARIIQQTPTYVQATQQWEIGDEGPVENLWLNSTSYPFALTQAAFLMAPARFTEQTWDTINNKILINNQNFPDQLVYTPTRDRPRNASLYVHGETLADGVTLNVVSGIQQWVSEYLASRAMPASDFGDAVRGLTVRLAHKMAGFTSTDELRTFTDNFGLIPQEDVSLVLYASPSKKEEFYSGIIIEWIGSGWRVIGYDNVNPEFPTLPGDPNGPKRTIKLDSDADTVIYEWRSNVYYKAGTVVEYKNTNWRCIKDHTSGPAFETTYWDSLNGLLTQSLRVYKSLYPLGTQVNVPYGTVFQTVQEVADFVFGYERYLVSRGWLFTDVDPETQDIRDWTMAFKDFMVWTQTRWEPGNFIALSPAAERLKYDNQFGTIYNIERQFNGAFGLLNQYGQPLTKNDVTVLRIDAEFELYSPDAQIYGTRINVGEIEHVLVFQNSTVFNDLIYAPLYDLRQPRIRLIGRRTMDWAGRLDAPGYVLVDNQIVSNLDKATEDIRYMFDIELADRKDLRDHARHVIGYQTRPYLDNILLSETEQFEFYQGAIQQKGAPGVFNKLVRSQYVGQDRDLEFFDEWGFKLGAYGGLNKLERSSFKLSKSDLRNNPQIVRFVDTLSTDPFENNIELDYSSSDWVDKPKHPRDFFPYRDPSEKRRANDMQTAGYARLDETDLQFFNWTDFENYFVNLVVYQDGWIENGQRIWVYNTTDFTWTVDVADPMKSTNTSVEWNVYPRYDYPPPTSSETFPPGGDFVLSDITCNRIAKITSYTVNEIIIDRTRYWLVGPSNLTQADVGNYVMVNGLTIVEPDQQGVHRIIAVGHEDGMDYLEVDSVTTDDFDFVEFNVAEMPEIRLLRPVRFDTIANANAIRTAWAPADGEIIYVDDDETENHNWIVYKWSTDKHNWVVARQQPPKIDAEKIDSALIYKLDSVIQDRKLYAEPLIIDNLTVIDPVGGLIPEDAKSEITYKIEVDPARYRQPITTSSLPDTVWGANQVGQLWWDLSTVRWLNTETDFMDEAKYPDRFEAEQTYRQTYWGKMAPGSVIDIYEWTESSLTPIEWAQQAAQVNPEDQYVGVIYTDSDGVYKYVETTKFDQTLGRMTAVYYFWVKNKITVPNGVLNRNMTSSAVADLIANPTSEGTPWIAPISNEALLVCNISEFINETDTVLQIDVRKNDYQGPVHMEWALLRSGDEKSAPPERMYRKMRDSMVGFDDLRQIVPDPNLHPSLRGGIEFRPRQTMFESSRSDDPRVGALEARESFVQKINEIAARTNFVAERPNFADYMSSTTPVDPYLLWVMPEGSTRVEALPPEEEWDGVQVPNYVERDLLLLTPEFKNSDRKRRVLVNGLTNDTPMWSVWEYDPELVNPSLSDDERLMQADSLFYLAKSYDYSVDSFVARNDLLGGYAPIKRGERVYVSGTTETNGFWTIWLYDPGRTDADSFGFALVRAQTYRTDDFWEYADWYADGYSESNPPVLTYADINARNAAQNPDPESPFVKIVDDGSGRWIWTAYTPPPVANLWVFNKNYRVGDYVEFNKSTYRCIIAHRSSLSFEDDATNWTKENGTWTVVAREKATFKLTTQFYNSNAVVFGLNNYDFTQITNRDGSWELRVLVDTFRDSGIFTDVEVNEIFFNMVFFAHAQQDQITWAMKTSFMFVGGYNEPMVQTPIQTVDNTQNIIDYIDEVKPYHVKVRDFGRIGTPDIDPAFVKVTDFDKPVYYDNFLKAYRRLDLSNPADYQILSTQEPWKFWFDNYNSNAALIRTFNVTMKFDRIQNKPVDGFDTSPFDLYGLDNAEFVNTLFDVRQMDAIQRAIGWYNPTVGMPAKNLEDLFNLGFNGALTDTLPLTDFRPTFTDWDNNVWEGTPYESLMAGLTPEVNYNRGLSEFDHTMFDTEPFDTLIIHTTDFETDGGELTANSNANTNSVTIDTLWNPDQNGRVGYGFYDPYHNPGHPEELVPLEGNLALSLNIDVNSSAGSLPQWVRTFDTATHFANSITLPIEEIAQSEGGIAVFRDGRRATEDEYSFDQFGRTVTVNLKKKFGEQVNSVTIHSFGVGGLTPILEQRFVSYQGNPVVIANTNLQTVVTWNGHFLTEGTDYTMTPNGINMLANIPDGDDIYINSYAPSPSSWGVDEYGTMEWGVGTTTTLDAETRVYTETFLYTDNTNVTPKVWTIANPSGPVNPEHATTIVEVAGDRLMPPDTYYTWFDQVQRSVRFDHNITDASQVKVWINGAEWNKTIPYFPTLSRIDLLEIDGQGPLLDLDEDVSDFDIYGFDAPGGFDTIAIDENPTFLSIVGYLVCTDTTFTAPEAVVSVYVDHDYEVANGVLTVLAPVTATDYDMLPDGWDTDEWDQEPFAVPIEVTTFTNNHNLGMRTYTFPANLNGQYPILYPPYDMDYNWINLNGKRLVAGVDFDYVIRDQGFGQDTFGVTMDQVIKGLKFTVPLNNQNVTKKVVATIFSGAPAQMGEHYSASTKRPSATIMQPIFVGDWDEELYDDRLYDTGQWQPHRMSPQGERGLYTIDGSYDYTNRNKPFMGVLMDDVFTTTSSFRVLTNATDISPKVMPENAWKLPEDEKPGIIWINGERIEYFSLEQDVNDPRVVTIAQLRRGTKGTSFGTEVRVSDFYQGDATTSVFTLVGAKTDKVEIRLVETNESRSVYTQNGDYSVELVGDDAVVTFLTPPAANMQFYIAATVPNETSHKTGTTVFDGNVPREEPKAFRLPRVIRNYRPEMAF